MHLDQPTKGESADVPRFREPARRLFMWMIGTAVPLLFVFLIGCPPPYEPKKLEMEPIGTTKNVPTNTLDDPGDGGVVAPNSGTTAQNSDTPAGSSICTGSFDDLADTLKSCEAPMPKGTDPLRGKLEVKVTGGDKTSPGGRVELQVTLRNTSSEPLAVYFTGDPFPHFDVEATDSKGRRVDLPPGRWPGYPKGFKPEVKEAKASKVTLPKDGTAKLKVTWDAVKTKWAPDRAKTWDGRGFPRVPDKPLAKGKYSLRVVLPILGDVDVPKVTIEIG
jgi:hypothetical protein